MLINGRSVAGLVFSLLCIAVQCVSAQTPHFNGADLVKEHLAYDLVDSGRRKMKQKDFKGAIADANKSIDICPTVAGYLFRGAMEAEVKNVQGAMADFSSALKIDPEEAAGYEFRGYLKARSGDLRGAISDLDKSIKLDPDNYDAYADRGATKELLHDPVGAIADYRKAITLNGSYLGAHRDLEHLLRQQGKSLEADKELDTINKLKGEESDR